MTTLQNEKDTYEIYYWIACLSLLTVTLVGLMIIIARG